MVKTCTLCKEQKGFSEFYPRKRGKFGLDSRCKECHKVLNKNVHKKWYERHREARIQRAVIWQRNNPEKHKASVYKRRRASKNNGNNTLTAFEIKDILMQNCIYCGACDNITIDHVVPLSRGGENSVNNVVPACYSCNSSKGDKMPLEFIMYKLRIRSKG